MSLLGKLAARQVSRVSGLCCALAIVAGSAGLLASQPAAAASTASAGGGEPTEPLRSAGLAGRADGRPLAGADGWIRAGLRPLSPRALASARRAVARRAPHIVGGQLAEPGYWQSTVQIVFAYVDGTFGFCTGSLFGARWVLTAGHCVAGSVGAAVGVGSYSIDDPKLQIVGVDDAWVNGGFAPPDFIDDVGFLRLERAVTQPGIRLLRADEPDPVAPGAVARIAGWGLTSTDAPDVSPDLLEATVPIDDDAACANLYGGGFSPEKMLCAGGQGAGTCFGDSGGPLVPQAAGRPVLAGMTSFGPASGCAPKGLPDVFMSVAAYSQGIVDFLAQDPVAPVGAPTVSAGRASQIAQTSALVSAVVDPHDLATDYQIVYAPATSVAQRGPARSVTTAPVATVTRYAGEATAGPVQLELAGLRPGTTYAYRVVASNAAGQASSASGTFKTRRDIRPPTVHALASRGKAGTRVALRYRAQDDLSATTHERVRVYDGHRLIVTIAGRPSAKKRGVVYHVAWKTPADRVGSLRFCVESTDEAGNRSAPSCAALRLT